MAVFRVAKTRDYTVMSNHHLRNVSLSLKAKGLLSQMLSLPEEWDYTLEGLAKLNCDGKDAIRSAVKELEASGYILRRRLKDNDGKFGGNEYVIYEQPISLSPSLDFPTMDFPTLENPTQLNKDKLNTNLSTGQSGSRSKPLTVDKLRELFKSWITGIAEEDWTRQAKNELYFALDGFYAPREKKKQEPARSAAGFAALANRLARYSLDNGRRSPTLMIDMLERATTAGWKSVFPLPGAAATQAEAGESKEAEIWLT